MTWKKSSAAFWKSEYQTEFVWRRQFSNVYLHKKMAEISEGEVKNSTGERELLSQEAPKQKADSKVKPFVEGEDEDVASTAITPKHQNIVVENTYRKAMKIEDRYAANFDILAPDYSKTTKPASTLDEVERLKEYQAKRLSKHFRKAGEHVRHREALDLVSKFEKSSEGRFQTEYQDEFNGWVGPLQMYISPRPNEKNNGQDLGREGTLDADIASKLAAMEHKMLACRGVNFYRPEANKKSISNPKARRPSPPHLEADKAAVPTMTNLRPESATAIRKSTEKVIKGPSMPHPHSQKLSKPKLPGDPTSKMGQRILTYGTGPPKPTFQQRVWK